MRLLIGIPASDEIDTIGGLGTRLERGVRRLAPNVEAEMVLAYQDGDEEVIRRWEQQAGSITRRVWRSDPGVSGRHRSVRLLLEAAAEADADRLLLVDADLVAYDPANLPRLVDAADAHAADLTLPVSGRPRLEGLVTNYVLCPLLYATYRARLRDPSPGHVLLSRRLVRHLLRSEIGGGDGVDASIAMIALAGNFRVAQPCVPPLRRSRSPVVRQRMLYEVARAAFTVARDLPWNIRSDVVWPDGYWNRWPWNWRGAATQADYCRLVRRHARTDRQRRRLEAHLLLPRAEARERWARRLAQSVHAAREGTHRPASLAADLVAPFYAHAWYQQETGVTRIEDVERDIASVSVSTARWLGLLTRRPQAVQR